MSYDIYMQHPTTGERLQTEVPHDLKGGSYAVGGTTEAWLNVTYNYANHFYRVLGKKGIRTIYGMTGRDALPLLESAASQLKDDTDPDYWKATEGNARKALLDLAALARLFPNGVFAGD